MRKKGSNPLIKIFQHCESGYQYMNTTGSMRSFPSKSGQGVIGYLYS